MFALFMVFFIGGAAEPLVMYKTYHTKEQCEAAKVIAQKAAVKAGADEGSLTCIPVKIGKFS